MNHVTIILANLNEENEAVGNSSNNCRNKEEYSLGGKCNIENIMYQVNISTKESKLNNKGYITI